MLLNIDKPNIPSSTVKYSLLTFYLHHQVKKIRAPPVSCIMHRIISGQFKYESANSIDSGKKEKMKISVFLSFAAATNVSSNIKLNHF